jgi:hypothetical protein
VTDLELRLTRRALLGAAVLVLAGCRSHGHATPRDADADALASARAGETALLSSYAEGTPDHTAHLAHLQALGGTPPTPAARSGATVAPAYTDLRGSVAVLQGAAVRARAGATAAAFASIAASHAVLAAPAP